MRRTSRAARRAPAVGVRWRRRSAMRARSVVLVLGAAISVGAPAAPLSADDPARVEIVMRDATAEAGLDGVAGDRFSFADYDGVGDPDLRVDGQRLFRQHAVP